VTVADGPMSLRRLLARLRDALAGRGPVADPWAREPVRLPPSAFGLGSVRDFAWYFEGDTLVAVDSLDALCAWLAGCAYVRDPDLFHDADFWQHPRTFERLRRGDCEDFALWAWRKLVEMGFDADLVVGHCLRDAEREGRHAWVVFRSEGGEFLFEPVSGNAAHAVRPLAEVKEHYVPEFGVGADRRRFAFSGYRRYWQR